MKASELNKKSISLEEIYKSIESSNKDNFHKHCIPHFVYVDEKIKLSLIENGFKVYRGDWDGVIKNALIIEW